MKLGGFDVSVDHCKEIVRHLLDTQLPPKGGTIAAIPAAHFVKYADARPVVCYFGDGIAVEVEASATEEEELLRHLEPVDYDYFTDGSLLLVLYANPEKAAEDRLIVEQVHETDRQKALSLLSRYEAEFRRQGLV